MRGNKENRIEAVIRRSETVKEATKFRPILVIELKCDSKTLDFSNSLTKSKMKVDQFSLHHYDSEDEDDFANSNIQQETKENKMARKPQGKKCNKPIMEKLRRARINNCLGELKGILLEAMQKDPARHSKLEKADILELTVRHLQNVQRNQLAVAMATDPAVLKRFKNGFAECATEVSRYLGRLDGVESGMRSRIGSHLGNCVNGLQRQVSSNSSLTVSSQYPSNGHFEVMPSPIAPAHPVHQVVQTPPVSLVLQRHQRTSGDFNSGQVMGSSASSVSSLSSTSSTATNGSGSSRSSDSSARGLTFVTTPKRHPTAPPKSPAARRLSLDVVSRNCSAYGMVEVWRPW